MTCYVIPLSLDTGKLGARVDAASPEAAAAKAAAETYAEQAGEAMVVRWDVRFDKRGQIAFARVTEVAPAGAKAEAPKAEAPKAEAPKAEAPKAEAPKAEAPKA